MMKDKSLEYYSFQSDEQTKKNFLSACQKVGHTKITPVLRHLINALISGYNLTETKPESPDTMIALYLEPGQKEALKIIANTSGVSQKELLNGLLRNFSENPIEIPTETKNNQQSAPQEVSEGIWEGL